MLDRIADGRTDLVFDYVASGNPATATANGVSLILWCAYHGDVSAIKLLLANGESLAALGENFDLNGAWRGATARLAVAGRRSRSELRNAATDRKLAASCETPAPKANSRCIAQPHSGTKKTFASYWTRVPAWTPKTPMEKRRWPTVTSHGGTPHL